MKIRKLVKPETSGDQRKELVIKLAEVLWELIELLGQVERLDRGEHDSTPKNSD
jgi:hypothetical protein